MVNRCLFAYHGCDHVVEPKFLFKLCTTVNDHILLSNMGSTTYKCNRLQLQIIWNFMITDYNNYYNYFFSK